MSKPLVSIACLTYNQEKFIKDAIEGFLSQKTDFDYEIIIHDDASTDRTADIVRQYEAKYPDKIHGIYQEENQFSKRNGNGGGMTKTYVYPFCRGKYIALCDGDDFWIDVNKLQIQIDYMESHPECMMTCHDAVFVDYRDITIYPNHPYLEERYLGDEEIIIQYHGDVATASTILRRDIFEQEPSFPYCPLGDYSLELYAITKGRIYFFPRIMSVYRSMHEGSWCRTHADDIERGLLLRGKVIDFLRKYDVYTNRKYHYAIIYKESLFILSSLRLCCNLSTGEVEKEIQLCNEKTESQYERFFAQLEAVYKQMYEEEYYPALMKEFAECYTHIYIWGAGKYGQRVAGQLRRNNKDFEAFIVSEPSPKEVMGKPIIGIDEIPYPIESVGIIIAVNIHNWDEIRGRFENSGQLHYIYPYGVTEII